MSTTTVITYTCDGCGEVLTQEMYDYWARNGRGWYQINYGGGTARRRPGRGWDLCAPCFSLLGKWMTDHTLRDPQEDS